MFNVNRSLSTSLPSQIATGMRGLVGSGTLVAGDQVPSTRELATQLGVSRGSVVTAYDQLRAEGFLVSSQGSATRINPDLRPVAVKPVSAHRATVTRSPANRLTLKPSSGHAGIIRPAAWRRAWREAAAAPAGAIDKAGQPELRAAIAAHLRLARGLAADPDNVLVTGGSREGLMLILMSLGRNLRVGVEDPGHPGLRNVIPLAGHTAVTCPTDSDGVIIPGLPANLDAILVTPSHLYPTGTSMPATRRAELLDWAAHAGVVVIEDDFNSELRYRVTPQPTLATLATDATVITLGTFATLLSRQLSAGYVVSDTATARSLGEIRKTLGMPVSPVTQRAIASLLASGHVRRTTKAVHRELARRREILSTEVIPALEQRGAVSGKSKNSPEADLLLTFSGHAERERFTAWIHGCGIECGKVDTGKGEAFLLSFGHLENAEFTRAVKLLTTAPPRD